MTDIKDIMHDKIIEPDYYEGDTENLTKVYKFYGSKVVKIYPDGTVTSEDPSRYYHRVDTNPRQTFPNMEVVDGEMRIPMCDIIEEIVARANKQDLARALLEDPDVRSNMVYGLSERYSQEGLNDVDRREFIDNVKEAIHSTALDKLANIMNTIEYKVREKAYYYDTRNSYGEHYRDVLESIQLFWNSEYDLEGITITDWLQMRHGDPKQFYYKTDKDYNIGGKHWNETRDFWRNKMIELFKKDDPTEEILKLLD
jgi:hypothetical protein